MPDLPQDFADRKAGEALAKMLTPLQIKDDAEHLPFGAVAKKAVIADLLETLREDMQKEAPDEFFIGESHHRIPVRAVVPVRKRGMSLRNGTDAGIGDGDAVGVTAKIFNGVAEAVKSLLDEGAPVLVVEIIDQGLPCRRIGQFAAGSRDMEIMAGIKFLEMVKEFAAELFREDLHRNEKGAAAAPEFKISGKTAARDDTVDMWMVFQGLAPGMEHLYDAGESAQKLRVSSKFQKSLGRALMKERVQKLLVGEEQGVQFMRHREYDVEIRSIDDLRSALVDPDLLQDRLTVRAIAVTAGIVMDPNVAAVGADADIAAEPAGLAVQKRSDSSHLLRRDKVLFGIRREGSIKDLLDKGTVFHRAPPFASKGETVLRSVDLASVT